MNKASWDQPELVIRYDPGPLREAVRASVTLIALFIFLCVISFYMFESSRTAGEPWQRIKEVMAVILPSVTSILGTALGFYFGSQKR